MKIQICFLRRNDVLSRIIKGMTNSIYSHTFICIDDLIVAETDFIHNFRLRLNPYKKCDYDAITLDLRDIQKEEIVDWMLENNGRKYDNFENWKWLFKSGKTDKNKLNCVEAVVTCLCDCFFLNSLFLERNMSPTELYHFLLNKPQY